jgi:predicted aldo/keto reductase-like oxidoreductase
MRRYDLHADLYVAARHAKESPTVRWSHLMEKLKNNTSLKRRDFFKAAVDKGMGTLLGFSILSRTNCKPNLTGMPERLLGRTKLSVSLLGFGCTQVKDQAVYRKAVELGINYFHMGDRDPAYNLDACSALLPFRKRLTIAYMSHPKDSRTLLLEDLDDFLNQSKLGVLDVWFVITPRPEVLNDFSEAVSLARTAGKIRFAGITTHNLDQDMAKLTAPESMIDVVMMTYNYLSPPDVKEKIDRLHRAGLGITPMKPLAGKFYEPAAEKPGPMLRWLAADQRIHTIPVIMTHIDQVEQNAAAIKSPLTLEDRSTLQTMFSYNASRFCRMCGSCAGKCPEGLSVSDLVRTAMYLEGYSDIRLARLNFSSIPEANRRITCDRCEQCSVTCPNGVAIKERIGVVKKRLA